MKRLLLLTVLSLLAVNTTAQAEEPDPLSFFPHHVGDTWVYRYYHGGVSTRTITNVWVEKDTTYIAYNGNNGSTHIIDNNHNVYFPLNGTKWLDYKLIANKEETWTVRPANIEKGDPRIEAYVADVYQTLLFGRSVTVKEIAYFYLYNGDTSITGSHAMYSHTQWLASGIGLIQELGEGSSEMEFVLTGCVIDGDTLGIVTGVAESGSPSFSVQAFPNPCTSLTTIHCSLPEGVSRGHLDVVDMFGRTVYSAEIQTDTHTINTSAFADGIYFCRVTVGTHTATQNIMVRS